MNSTCFVTLERRSGGKIMVSPELPDETQAAQFLQLLLLDIGHFIMFYRHDNHTFLNDDFILAVEPLEDCLDMDLIIDDASGLRVVDLSFEAAMNFIEGRKPSI
ncbi:hypothetical protein [Litoribacter populi]|uniref:hypothetical protein n=1 Tax=Litoribacter populi TaxID=2598460 RepID=UPI00117BE6E8|nr:hypothetical protein [Litoribacter populi]